MGLISPEDMDLIHYFKTPEEGIEILKPRMTDLMTHLNCYHEV